ncbi:conserved hypothetical protein [Vibrio phage 249E41-1]|nr:conserved hypothetical protein [Vibrio phage 249E41-1]CAH9016511.1 conserved hypothetical protein [Vibrio phage 193E37-1]
MSDFKCITRNYLKDSKFNGGWGSVGDGNMTTKLFLEKDGVTMVLKDKEINELLRSLQSVNSSIRVR